MPEVPQPGQPIVEMRGPFPVVERNEKHNRFGIVLNEDSVINPDGSPGTQYWINFPNRGVMVFPMDEAGDIYFAEAFTYATNEYALEGAGGMIDPGETDEEAAMREVREELGVVVAEDSLVDLGTYGATTSRVNNPVHTFWARVESVGETNLESGEVILLKKLQLDQALEYIRSGVISNSTVAAALWRINDFLNNPSESPRPDTSN